MPSLMALLDEASCHNQVSSITFEFHVLHAFTLRSPLDSEEVPWILQTVQTVFQDVSRLLN